MGLSGNLLLCVTIEAKFRHKCVIGVKHLCTEDDMSLLTHVFFKFFDLPLINCFLLF